MAVAVNPLAKRLSDVTSAMLNTSSRLFAESVLDAVPFARSATLPN